MWINLYKLTNRLNGMDYVGITSRPIKDRFARHVYSAKRGSTSRIHTAIRKYGRKIFELELLCKVNSIEKALKLETKFIKRFNTLWPNGYNALAIGGVSLGYKYTEEQRLHISKACKGRIPWNKGKKTGPLSKEHRKKLSEHSARKGKPALNKGIPHSGAAKRRMSQAHLRRYKDPKERRKTGKHMRRMWASNPEKAAAMGRKISKIRAAQFWSTKKKSTNRRKG